MNGELPTSMKNAMDDIDVTCEFNNIAKQALCAQRAVEEITMAHQVATQDVAAAIQAATVALEDLLAALRKNGKEEG
ncbi:hypothetical protein [Streptomyces cucumeris]|uniref:hypothetical protein n=1 Tax=Streptomyces cucumeris TaxID=2962890 RepID=UPI0020C85C58|nr:hypothetical protein [Streptomyces sp. NEAU-Y11]MCP9209696.1 hypothetical protein [Streptomyces sp. NEAU-Y11]